MTASLRFRLTASLVAVLGTALAGLSLVLHVVMDRALQGQLDGRLDDDASAVAGMAEDEAGSAEFEYESLPDFERTDRPAYFQAWLDDGTVLARSPSLGGRDLPRARAGGVRTNLTLPDGRPGRSLTLRQGLRIESPAGVPGALPGRSSRSVTVVVARGTEELREALATVRRWLALLASLTVLGASAAIAISVSRSLRSTKALAAGLAELDAAKLGPAFPTEGLPAELVPLVRKLNELLARVEASFARERRFTADVSHELRTPLAGLRTTLEVALSRERGAEEYRAAIAEAEAVARQMQSLCENLLILARLDAGAMVVRREEAPLRDLVESCWRPLAPRARERGLTFTNELDPSAAVTTDVAQLRIVVSNLLSNAVSYTAPGGSIAVRAGGRAVLLEVDDTGPRIPDDVLPHIFDRFVRGDPARSDGVHCGIGLALVRGLCEAMDLAVTARNTAEGGVSFRLSQAA